MILITGSTGYIGSHLSLYFQKKKIEFIGIDNLSYSYKSNINKKANHFFFDISSKKKVFFGIFTPNSAVPNQIMQSSSTAD